MDSCSLGPLRLVGASFMSRLQLVLVVRIGLRGLMLARELSCVAMLRVALGCDGLANLTVSRLV